MSGSSPLLWALLGALLCTSAFFSASETALFALTPAERRAGGERVNHLLADTRRLLVTVLLCNLVVNLLFFAFASRISLGPEPYQEVVTGLAALLTVLCFGEVLPKTVALRGRVAIARWGSLPLTVLVDLLRPAHRAADGLLELAYRVLGDAGHRERGVTTEFLGQALERSARQGLLLDAEAELLAGVVELGEVRVREIMVPRVDMLLLDLGQELEQRAAITARAARDHLTWVTVVEGNPDQVVGRVRTRDLLMHPLRPVRDMLAPVLFVPEVASAMHLLHFLRDSRLGQGLVVDEWGGTAGVVTIENVFEHVVGDLRVEGERPAPGFERLPDGRFLVDGSLPIRDWNELFGFRLVPTEYETLGGWVTALLGRIPRAGDEARVAGLVFEVRAVRRRRVVSVEVRVEEPALEPASKESEA